jgi:hypothetical protein
MEEGAGRTWTDEAGQCWATSARDGQGQGHVGCGGGTTGAATSVEAHATWAWSRGRAVDADFTLLIRVV